MNKLIIAITRLVTKILGNLTFRTIRMSEQTANDEVINNSLLKKLKEVYAVYDEVVIKPLSSGLGNKVIEADRKRDNIFYALKNTIDGLARLDGTKGDAARALQRLFDEAGTITGVDYGSESEVIKKLLKLLASDTAKAHLTTLSLTDEAAMLEPAQNEFHAIFMEQSKINAALIQQGSATGLRREVEYALRSYYAYVWAMKDQPTYKTLYSELAELVKAAKNTIGKKETDLTNTEIELKS